MKKHQQIMGQKPSTRSTVVRKRHKKCWKNYKKEIDNMIISQRKVFHCAADRVLRCPSTETVSSFNCLIESWTKSTGFSLKMQKDIVKSISQIASSIFIQPTSMSEKEVNHNFKSQAFTDSEKDIVMFLLLSYNITTNNDEVELSISLTLSVYQASPRSLFWPRSVSSDSAVGMCDSRDR